MSGFWSFAIGFVIAIVIILAIARSIYFDTTSKWGVKNQTLIYRIAAIVILLASIVGLILFFYFMWWAYHW